MEESQKKNEDIKDYTPWYTHPYFKYAVGILLALTIILVFYQVGFILTPIIDFISILFIPIVVSFLFYYLLRPIVYFFEDHSVPRIVTILCIYFLIALLLIFFIAYIGPILATQITELANTSVVTLEKVKESSQSFVYRFFQVDLDYEIRQRIFNIAQQITTTLSKNLVDFLGFLTRVAAILAVTPFIVFYLLKDDRDFSSAFLRFMPEDFAIEVKKILRNMDTTLSSYITGLILISSTIGILLFFGYLIIGLPYALILAFIALIFTSIPYLGPFLAIAPAIFVALSVDTWMFFKVVFVFVIVQQIESNLVSPVIIGQRLKIHPLTIILLLLAAGSLYGLFGLILATPFYALAKVLIENLYKIYQLHYSHGKK